MNDSTRPTIQPDVLGEEQAIPAVPDLQDQPGTRRASRETAVADGGTREDAGGRESGEARPGTDENQAGFVKDAGKRFQP